MKQQSNIHRYINAQSLERLLLLIATFIKYPGIGCFDDGQKNSTNKHQHHNALELVQIKLRELAASLKIALPENYPATPTIRKDLELLRDYGILDRSLSIGRVNRFKDYLKILTPQGRGIIEQQKSLDNAHKLL